MTEGPDKPSKPRETSASPEPAAGAKSSPSPSERLVADLVARFTDQLRTALGLEEPALADAGATALAYADHYLAQLREETREPIVSLVAAGAGAWFGELIRREVGAQWIGDGQDPRRLRLLLEPQFVHFSPIDMAYEAIFSGSPDPGDPRIPEGAALDGAYHLRKRAGPSPEDLPESEDEPGQRTTSELSDHDWIAERLAATPPLPEDQFFSLTGRYETLLLILELLAGRDLGRGRQPTRYHLNDYVEALTQTKA